MTVQVNLSWLNGKREDFEKAVQDYIDSMHAFAHTIGVPRPTSAPLVMNCVSMIREEGKPDRYIPNYTIVDDVTQPEPSLAVKKQMLDGKLAVAEQAAIESVIPLRKQRAFQYEYNDARLSEDEEKIAACKAKLTKIEKIREIAAKASASIEDLDETTIDSWQLPSFD